jgi:hypothetical protein
LGEALVSVVDRTGDEAMTVKRRYLISAAALLLLNFLAVHAAEQDTVQAIIPWEAEGRVFQTDTNTMMFLGAFTGVMYIESSQGEMHEAFVMCPIIQTLNLDLRTTRGCQARPGIRRQRQSVAYRLSFY